jgi:hypothetical protein
VSLFKAVKTPAVIDSYLGLQFVAAGPIPKAQAEIKKPGVNSLPLDADQLIECRLTISRYKSA